MPPAVAAAGIMAAGTIGGAVLGGSAQKKAANQAADAQTQATNAQLQLGRESMALNKDIYNQNKAVLSPFVNRGNVAGDAINALLGLPSAAPAAAATGVQTASPVSQVPVPANYNQTGYSPATSPQVGPGTFRLTYPSGQRAINDLYGNDLVRSAHTPASVVGGGTSGASGAVVQNAVNSPTPTATAGGSQVGATGAATGVTPLSAQDAFQNFANSAGMQFQLKQGANALNNLYAAHGALQSGAAMKALQDYGQQTALNNYFLPYLGLLGGQQSVGAGAASSTAGVGQNFGNTAASINNAMSGNIQNGADALSNAALIRGQANANMYSGIGSALGGLGSSFFPIPR